MTTTATAPALTPLADLPALPTDVHALTDSAIRADLSRIGRLSTTDLGGMAGRRYVALANERHARITAGTWTGPAVNGTTVLIELDNDGRPAPLPSPRCTERADVVRRYAASAVRGPHCTDVTIIAWRMAYDAHAAGEIPRPALSDAVDLAAVRPDLMGTVWHHTAGATILGPGCDCAPPAGHRDALVTIARSLTA